MTDWEKASISKVFYDSGVDCYHLDCQKYLNEYFILSAAETRKLMNSPEVVGYEVYKSLVKPTSRMLKYLNANNKISLANILCILRGALNFPIEESCYKENIHVHNISFLSCERVFTDDKVTGLDVNYRQLTVVPDGTLIIGDIIASGDTIRKCLEYTLDFYLSNGKRLKNIVFFTIGAKKGIELFEKFTEQIRKEWPEFEGFIVIYYEGVFNCYEEGDKGVSGINRANIDFYWKDGIISPEFHKETLSAQAPLFEKCTIYDGGARRYEIHEHIEEVLEFWNCILERADIIDKQELLEEKLGHKLPISYEDWIRCCHYEKLDCEETYLLYEQEQNYVKSLENISLKEMANQRIIEFTRELSTYILKIKGEKRK